MRCVKCPEKGIFQQSETFLHSIEDDAEREALREKYFLQGLYLTLRSEEEEEVAEIWIQRSFLYSPKNPLFTD